MVVGRKDRKTLASAIHEVAAQLREYAAYFEQERYQRLVQDEYGLKIYKPRLIAIVGRDPKLPDEGQERRLMTQYPDLRFITFDKLLEHARSNVLI